MSMVFIKIYFFFLNDNVKRIDHLGTGHLDFESIFFRNNFANIT